MNQRQQQRRAFLRAGLVGAGGLAAGAAALWVSRRALGPVEQNSSIDPRDAAPGPSALAPLRPWLGFAAAGATDAHVGPATAAAGRLDAAAIHLNVSGQVPESLAGLDDVALEVLFGPEAQYPFHAWSASLAPQRSVSPGVACRVPVQARGVALRLTVQGALRSTHDLVLGGPAGAAPLAPGHYFVALAPASPRWTDFTSVAEAGGPVRLLDAHAAPPKFACLAVSVAPV